MKNTVNTLLQQKKDGNKITMLTCYDYSTAKLMEEVGVNTSGRLIGKYNAWL